MSTQTGLSMVSKILGQEFKELDALAQSGVAEIGNVISGRATVKLAEAGYQSTISPPTMVIGKGVKISTLDFPRIVTPLVTELGNITVHLALRESPMGDMEKNFVPLIKSAVVAP
jgi:chemotaxis protein CheX